MRRRVEFEGVAECAGALEDSNRSIDERHTLSSFAMLGLLLQIGILAVVTFLVWRWFGGTGAQQAVTQAAVMMMMPFNCSYRNKKQGFRV
jgi:hypothetical protein